MDKKKLYGTIVGIFSFVLLIAGLTYAYFYWAGNTDDVTNVNLTVVRGLENSIVYKQGVSILETDNMSLEAVNSYSESTVSATIEFWKKPAAKRKIYGQLTMEILKILSATGTTDANIGKTDTIKWAVTTYTVDNPTEVLLQEGTFNKRKQNDKFEMLEEYFELNTVQTFYKIYLWLDVLAIDTSAMIDGESLSVEIGAIATDVKPSYDKIDNSNANAPAYAENLVPVMYDGTNWVTADTTSSTSEYGWYDYDDKKWANAVLLTETKRNSLTKDANGLYTPGQTIGDTESAGVLAFYVWIPRYKYKVWNIDKIMGTSFYTYDAYTKGIDIIFEEGTSTTGGITCDYSYAEPSSVAGEPNEKCNDSGNEGNYTHPAFTFGVDELTGFWMGKFELSSSSPSSSDGGGELVTLTPRILPNVTSWRNNYVESFWKVIKDMQVSNNIYGLSTDTTKLDSHMLTNMEWGAVAYLTHSKYGRCTGGANSTCVEVTLNANDNYQTGYSNSSTYTPSNGQLASTTGNIYGVYDMSGGADEYVMGDVSSSSGSYAYNVKYAANGGTYYTYSGNEKYLTTYAYGFSYDNQTAYNRGRLGDATGEVVTAEEMAWYSDYARFPYATNYPWFLRGGGYDYGSYAGVFYFSSDNGGSYSYNSSRGALAVLGV